MVTIVERFQPPPADNAVRSRSGLARSSVTALGLWIFCVAASAPLTTLVGGVVTTYGVTGVVGVPLSFLLLAAALGFMSVGYVALARRLQYAAPFYACLAHGLGRMVGLPGAAVALLGYTCIKTSLYGLVGATLADFTRLLNWWQWAGIVWAIIAVVGLFRTTLGAKLLGALLAGELVIIGVFIVVAVNNPAGGALSAAPLLPQALASPAVGAVAALGVAAFVGIDTGAALSEEARTPQAVGRATTWALLFTGPFYALMSWALAVAVGPDQVAARAAADPLLPLTVLSEHFGHLGFIVAGIGKALFVTSIVGTMISFHGTAARYTYVLAREGLFPTSFARTGIGVRKTMRDAPVGGSIVQTVIAGAVIAAFAAGGRDPIAEMFLWLATIAALAILALLTASSLAALVWFRRHRTRRDEGTFVRTIAPVCGTILGAAAFVVTVVFQDATAFARVVVVAALAGLWWAVGLRSFRPKIYQQIGRGHPRELVPDRQLGDLVV